MSIEDRSLDASKEEGTATVIDGSDAELSERGPVLLHSKGAEGYLHIDGNESLRADGNNSDHDTKFKLHITGAEGKDQIVILEHYKPKVVAIDANKVITKEISSETFKEFTNLSKVKTNHPDILFKKIPRAKGSALFHLKPYLDDTQMVGFNKKGDPTVADAESNNDKFLFEIK